MPTLHLGVIDLPYTASPPKRRKRRSASTVTTGDVAGWLENKYHVMEIFYEQHADDIVGKELINSLQGYVQSLMQGAPLTIDPFGTATSKIEDGLKQFIISGEMDSLGYPGVPTKAAQDRSAGRRRGARFKSARATATGQKAVSFYDSGLYEGSIKSWVT